jgi:hypothetical protein
MTTPFRDVRLWHWKSCTVVYVSTTTVGVAVCDTNTLSIASLHHKQLPTNVDNSQLPTHINAANALYRLLPMIYGDVKHIDCLIQSTIIVI